MLPQLADRQPAAEQPQHRGTLAEQSCYGTYHSDGSDGSSLDAAAYGLFYGCISPGGWVFDVSTYDSFTTAQIGGIDVYGDTDRDATTGCSGFEWNVYGTRLSTTGELAAGVFYLPSCDAASAVLVADASFQQPTDQRLALLFENSAWGDPSLVNWVGDVFASDDTSAEFLPKAGVHQESGFLGGCAPQQHAGYFAVSHTPRGAAAVATAVRGAGARDVTAGGRVVRFSGDPARLQRVLDRQAPGVHVRPDVLRHVAEQPNDAERGTQWNLDAVGAAAAWDVTRGSSSVSVAVLDSGFDSAHSDLAGKLRGGYDASLDAPLAPGNTDDATGHGTATAGVVAAATGNGIGLSSIGYDTTVMPIKVADAQGRLPTSLVIRGLHHAADRGASVINISLGGCQPLQEEADAVRYAQDRGALVVAAAGNSALEGNPVNYPAAYDGVLGVGATGFDGRRARYSNTGAYVDLVAPGGSADGVSSHDVPVLQAGGGTRRVAGTSFASPMVAGAAALLLALDPTMTSARLAEALRRTARDLGQAGVDPEYGAGLLDVHAAVLAARPAAASPPSSAVSPSPSAASSPSPSAVSPSPSAASSPSPSAVSSPPASPAPAPASPAPSAAPGPPASGAAPAGAAATGLFQPLPPERVLDTRNGTGGVSGRLRPGTTSVVDVAGRSAVPPGAQAVALNLTATASTGSGYLTVFRPGTGVPDASNLNYPAGQTVPNLVVVPLSADGSVAIFSNAGSPHVIADVVGFYRGFGEAAASDSSFVPLPPARVLDTRSADSDVRGRLPARVPVEVQVTGRGGVPTTAVTGVVLNTTVTGAAAAGFLTVFPGGPGGVPLASNLNYRAGQTVPNLVMVPVGPSGTVRLYSNTGGPFVIADVVGYYTSDQSRGRLTPLAPARVLDTRSGVGGTTGRLPAGGRVSLPLAGRGGVPPRGARAVVLNTTVTGPAGSGHLTVFPGGAPAPVASNLNYVRGQTVANLVVVPLNDNGTVDLVSNAGGPFAIADVVAWIS